MNSCVIDGRVSSRTWELEVLKLWCHILVISWLAGPVCHSFVGINIYTYHIYQVPYLPTRAPGPCYSQLWLEVIPTTPTLELQHYITTYSGFKRYLPHLPWNSQTLLKPSLANIGLTGYVKSTQSTSNTYHKYHGAFGPFRLWVIPTIFTMVLPDHVTAYLGFLWYLPQAFWTMLQPTLAVNDNFPTYHRAPGLWYNLLWL